MPAYNFIDLTGQQFSRLVVIDRAKSTTPRKRTLWNCICECGNKTVVDATVLRSGHTKSCGCLHKMRSSCASRTHGLSDTVEYTSWSLMSGRCNNPNNHKYPAYGGRGIVVCDRWSRFENFFADMGIKPSSNHSIDRIDNDGNYEPSNCRWATAQEQATNRRRPSTNKTGVVGVYKLKDGRYMSDITRHGITHHIYSGKNFAEACKRRKAAELKFV